MEVPATSASTSAAPDAAAAPKTQPIKGHAFSKILEGEQRDHYVNRSGNARDGDVFTRVWRDGRCFHVYGEGKDRAVFEVTPRAKAGAGGAAAPPAGTQ